MGVDKPSVLVQIDIFIFDVSSLGAISINKDSFSVVIVSSFGSVKGTRCWKTIG